ncbi:hypothetical protein GCM10022245_28610 [Streptomyces mayteni]
MLVVHVLLLVFRRAAAAARRVVGWGVVPVGRAAVATARPAVLELRTKGLAVTMSARTVR